MIKSIYTFIIGFFLYTGIYAQPISGVYYIGGGGSPAFSSLNAAFSYINTNGIAGPLTLQIAAGYTETAPNAYGFQLGSALLNSGLNANAGITIRKNGNGANPVFMASTGGSANASTIAGPLNGIIALSGTDYITLENLNFIENPANTSAASCMEYGIGLFKWNATDACQNITIKNCTIQLSLANSAPGAGCAADGSCGIWMANTKSTNNIPLVITGNSGTHSGNTFINNQIAKAHTGVYCQGYADTTGTYLDHDNTLSSNTIINFGNNTAAIDANGIHCSGNTGLLINGNYINNNDGSSTNHNDTLRGIFVENAIGASLSILYNTLIMQAGINSKSLHIIENTSGSNNSNNTIAIQFNTLDGARFINSNGECLGILNRADHCGSVYITSNSLSYFSIKAAILQLIQHRGSITNAIAIDNNPLDSINCTASVFHGIQISDGTDITGTLEINNNTLTRYSAIISSYADLLSVSSNASSSQIHTNTINALNFTGSNGSISAFSISGNVAPGNSWDIQNDLNTITQIQSVLYVQTNLDRTSSIEISQSTFHDISSTSTLQLIRILESNAQIKIHDNSWYSIQAANNLDGLRITLNSGIALTDIGYNQFRSIQSGNTSKLTLMDIISDSGDIRIHHNTIRLMYGNEVYGIKVTTNSRAAVLGNKIGHLFGNIVSAIDIENGLGIIAQNTIYQNYTGSGYFPTKSSLLYINNNASNSASLVLKGNILYSDIKPALNGNPATILRFNQHPGNRFINISDYNLFYSDSVQSDRPLYCEDQSNPRIYTDLPDMQHRGDDICIHAMIQNCITYFKSVNPQSANYLSIDETKANVMESNSDTSGLSEWFTWLKTDIDNDIRAGMNGSNSTGTAWDIGADEFNGIRAASIIKPYAYFDLDDRICPSGNYTFPVHIISPNGISLSNLNSAPALYFRKNNGTWQLNRMSYVSGTKFNSNWNATILLNAVNGLNAGDTLHYAIAIQDTLSTPNIAVFPNTGWTGSSTVTVSAYPNNPYQIQIGKNLNGVYHIGKNGDFTSISQAATMYNLGCLNGAVRFQLTDSLYSAFTGEQFPIVFRANPSSSPSNSFSIEPLQSLTIDADSNELFRFEGSDYMHFGNSNFTIHLIQDSTRISSSAMITLLNDGSSAKSSSHQIELEHLQFTGVVQQAAYNSNLYGGISSNFGNDSIHIHHCQFEQLDYAVNISGGNSKTGNAVQGIEIDHNQIQIPGMLGIGVFYSDHADLHHNQISVYGSSDYEISGIRTDQSFISASANSIKPSIRFNSIDSVSNQINHAIGISTAGGDINNNLIQGIFGNAHNNAYNSNMTGIRMDDTCGTIRNNTVFLDAEIQTLFNPQYSFCVWVGANAEVHNNIFQNSIDNPQAFGNTNTVAYFNTIKGSLGHSNHNIYYAPTLAFTNSILLKKFGTPANTLVSWQQTTGMDGLSTDLTPAITSTNFVPDTSSSAYFHGDSTFSSGKDLRLTNRHPKHPCIGAFEADYLEVLDTLNDISTCANTNVKLAYHVISGSPKQFIWLKNNQIISSATADTLAISPMHASDTGIYSAVISNAKASINTPDFALHLKKATSTGSIVGSNQVLAGDTIQLAVNPSGSGSVSLQWFFKDSLLVNQTATTFQKAHVLPIDAGAYSIKAHAECGDAISDTFHVNILPNHFVFIQNQPISASFCSGTTATSSVSAISDESLQYQWYRNQNALIGQTAPSISLANFSVNDTGKYYVHIQNSHVSTYSDTVPMHLLQPIQIIQQPVSTFVNEGDSIRFTITASGSGNVQYTWYLRQNKITTTNGNSIFIPQVKAADTGMYFVQLDGPCGTVYANAFRLSMHYITQTQKINSAKVCSGTRVVFRTPAISNEVISYQWFKNNVPIIGATRDSFVISSADTSWEAVYFCKFSTTHITRYSDTANLQVRKPITISALQFNGKDKLGDTAVFSISITPNDSTIQYQWMKDGISLGTSLVPQWIIAGLGYDQTGDYSVQVNSLCESISSNSMHLTIRYLQIIQQPISGKTCKNLNAYFSAQADGSDSISYQWYKNGVAISGAKNASLFLNKVQDADSGAYVLACTNLFGTIFSDTVHLSLMKTTRILQASKNRVANIGSAVQLFAYAEGEGKLRYRWYKNGTITNYTDSILSFASLNYIDSGSYQIQVSGICGSLYSDTMLLIPSMANSMYIAEQPLSQKICRNSLAQLHVQAYGNGNLHYQWRKNGTAIAGDTLPYKTFTSFTDADMGNYTVWIQSDSGSVLSDNAVISAYDSIDITGYGSLFKVNIGQILRMTVTATGPIPLHYTWYMNSKKMDGLDTNTYQIDSATMNLSGIYRVEVRSVCETKSTGNMTVIIHDPTGMESISISGIRYYPIPANESLQIDWSESTFIPNHIHVFDMQGKSVFQTKIEKGLKQWSLDVNAYPNGMYFIEMFDELGRRNHQRFEIAR